MISQFHIHNVDASVKIFEHAVNK